MDEIQNEEHPESHFSSNFLRLNETSCSNSRAWHRRSLKHRVDSKEEYPTST